MATRNENPLLQMSKEELTEIIKRVHYLQTDILKINQVRFSDSINVSQSYYSLLLSGKKDITINVILEIASTFKINLDWLIYGIGDDNSIFESEQITTNYLREINKEEALNILNNAYSLKSSDLEFFSWYLSLSPEQRLSVNNAVSLLTTLNG